MKWFSKFARADFGHGDTLSGQMMKQERERLTNTVRRLKTEASTGGPESVLPRWRGELRRKILLLPALDRIANMSMYELRTIDTEVDGIKAAIERYDANRFLRVMGDAGPV